MVLTVVVKVRISDKCFNNSYSFVYNGVWQEELKIGELLNQKYLVKSLAIK